MHAIEQLDGINGTYVKLNTRVALPTEFPVVMETNKLATEHHLGQVETAREGKYGVITVNRNEVSHTSLKNDPEMRNVNVLPPFAIVSTLHEEALNLQTKEFEEDMEGMPLQNQAYVPVECHRFIDDIITVYRPIKSIRMEKLKDLLNLGFN